MRRSVKYLALAATFICTLSFPQAAHAVHLLFGTKPLDLTNSANDCLTRGLAALNTSAFSKLSRSDIAVHGTRQNVLVVITCVPSPKEPQFVVVVMAAGDNAKTVKSLKDLVVSNL